MCCNVQKCLLLGLATFCVSEERKGGSLPHRACAAGPGETDDLSVSPQPTFRLDSKTCVYNQTHKKKDIVSDGMGQAHAETKHTIS